MDAKNVALVDDSRRGNYLDSRSNEMTPDTLTVQNQGLESHNARNSRISLLQVGVTIAVTLLISAIVGFAVIEFRETMKGMGNWGYLGVFLVEGANSAAVMIPTPSIAYTLTMSAVLNPFLIGIAGGIGASLGELVGYALGASGRRMLEGSRLQGYFETIARRRVGPALFAFALLPIPFDIAGIWAGTVRYSPRRFIVYVTAGKIIKVTGIALAGYYSVNWILGFLG